MSDACEVRFVGNLQRLDVKPDDVFVLMFEERLTQERLDGLMQVWEDRVPFDNKIIVLDDGAKLGVIRADD